MRVVEIHLFAGALWVALLCGSSGCSVAPTTADQGLGIDAVEPEEEDAALGRPRVTQPGADAHRASPDNGVIAADIPPDTNARWGADSGPAAAETASELPGPQDVDVDAGTAAKPDATVQADQDTTGQADQAAPPEVGDDGFVDTASGQALEGAEAGDTAVTPDLGDAGQDTLQADALPEPDAPAPDLGPELPDVPPTETGPDSQTDVGPDSGTDAKPAEDTASADLPPPPQLLVVTNAGKVSCDDANACTTDDRFVAGTCIGVWKVCSDDKPCTVDACQPATGNCTFGPSLGGCEDGNACTVGDSCTKAGSCAPGKSVTCDDGLPCSVDACNPKTGCTHVAAKKGSACGADSWCLSNGACVLKISCMGMPALCDDGESCTIDWCEGMGGCVHMPADDNDHCDDGDPCTPMPTDKCKSGKCKNIKNVCGCQVDADCAQMDDGDQCNGVQACLPSADGSLRCQPKPASAVVCAALPASSCKVASCDPTTGQCLALPMPNGAWCDDGDACSVSSSCEGGVCKGAQALQCQAAAGCNAATCDSAAGCQQAPGCGCATCDDGDPCTIDTCVGSGCSFKPVQCPSLGPCLVTACKGTASGGYQCEATALLSVAPLAVPVPCSPFNSPSTCAPGYMCKVPADNPGAGWCTPLAQVPCDDGLACTVNDVCDMGACRSGPAATCDDDNPCTLDVCNAAGCTSTPIPNCKLCVDQNFETESWKPQWAMWTDSPGQLKWKVDKNFSGNTTANVNWTGGMTGNEDGSMGAYLQVRRLYADTGTPATLEFKYRALLGYDKCGLDDLEVVVNGQLLWRACSSSPGGTTGPWQQVKVDLGVVAGGGFDVEFRAIAGASKQGLGAIEIDKVRVAGACNTACLAAHVDPTGDARDVPSSPIPHGFKLTSTAPTYSMWAPTATGGQLGPGAMTVKYNGAPPGLVPATATWRIPQVRPVAGSVLQFSARTLLVGDLGCGGDDLVVAVGGVAVVQLCGVQPLWKNYKVDLSAWAGKTVDVTVSAVSGSAAAASGVFQVDNLTVTGSCSYACMLAHFESAAEVAGWWKGTTPSAPPWALQSDGAAVGDGTMGVDLDKELPQGAVSAVVPAMQWRWPVPVGGMTFEVQAKVTADTETCPMPILRVRMAHHNEGLSPADPKLATTSSLMHDVLESCAPSTGFVKHEVELGDPLRARKAMPVFILQKPMGAASVGVRIDEFVMRCK
ncbi:MAG: hypothetical protein FJ100_19255 [Deltaproteobacteria bacterium]|nr:hypothetical protein [Deltaproteobacteria bacterium]